MPEPIIICATVVTVAFFAYKSFSEFISAPRKIIEQGGSSTEDLVKTIASELRKTFNAEPVITINRVVIQQSPQRICEFSLAKQIVEVREEWSNEQYWSKKMIAAEQRFVVKAGFDFNRVRIEFNQASRQARIIVSDSTIVSVEPLPGSFDSKSEDGWWNKISDDERNKITNSLPEKAKAEACKRELTSLAVEQLKVVLGNFFRGFGIIPEIICQNQNLLLKNSLPEIPEDKLRSIGICEEKRSGGS